MGRVLTTTGRLLRSSSLLVLLWAGVSEVCSIRCFHEPRIAWCIWVLQCRVHGPWFLVANDKRDDILGMTVYNEEYTEIQDDTPIE